MEKKVITDEQFKKVLDAFYPGGYGRTNDRGEEDAWYIGWFGINGKTECGLPLEIDRDDDSSIVFLWWSEPCCSEITRDELVGYIRGVLSVLLPDIELVRNNGKWGISFSYSEENDL